MAIDPLVAKFAAREIARQKLVKDFADREIERQKSAPKNFDMGAFSRPPAEVAPSSLTTLRNATPAQKAAAERGARPGPAVGPDGEPDYFAEFIGPGGLAGVARAEGRALQRAVPEAIDAGRAIAGSAVRTVGSSVTGVADISEATGRLVTSVLPENMRAGATRIADPLGINKRLRSLGDAIRASGDGFDVPEEQRKGDGYLIASTVGQLATQVATSLVGGGTVSTLSLAGQGANQIADKAREKGTEGKTSSDLAVVGGAVVSAVLNKVSLDVLVGKLPPSVAGKLTSNVTALAEKTGLPKLLARLPDSVAKTVAGKLVKYTYQGGVEAGQEYLDQFSQNLVVKLGIDPDQELNEGARDSVVAGGVAGFFISAALDALPGKARGGAVEQEALPGQPVAQPPAPEAAPSLIDVEFEALTSPEVATAPTKRASKPNIPSITPAQRQPDALVGNARQVFKARVESVESGGDQNAKNPRSSASGGYQFIDSTFRSYYKRVYGVVLSNTELAKVKNDPEIQSRLFDALTADNEHALRRAGQPVTAGNLYLSHFLGSGGAVKTLANPDGVPSAEVVKANPQLAGMNNREVAAWAEQRMGRPVKGMGSASFANGESADPAEFDYREARRAEELQQGLDAIAKAGERGPEGPTLSERTQQDQLAEEQAQAAAVAAAPAEAPVATEEAFSPPVERLPGFERVSPEQREDEQGLYDSENPDKLIGFFSPATGQVRPLSTEALAFGRLDALAGQNAAAQALGQQPAAAPPAAIAPRAALDTDSAPLASLPQPDALTQADTPAAAVASRLAALEQNNLAALALEQSQTQSTAEGSAPPVVATEPAQAALPSTQASAAPSSPSLAAPQAGPAPQVPQTPVPMEAANVRGSDLASGVGVAAEAAPTSQVDVATVANTTSPAIIPDGRAERTAATEVPTNIVAGADAIARVNLPPSQAITSGREVPVRYALVEASSLVTSNTADGSVNPAYPAELQPRDRQRGTSQTQIQNIAANLDPRLLGPSPKASDGAPIISPNGVVESGNGRSLAIQRAYEQGGQPAEQYRAALEQAGYDTAGLQQPVLVRVREGDLSPADLQAFTREANQRDNLGFSSTEQAASDADALGDSIVNLYRGGDIDAAANRDFVRAVMSSVFAENDRASMIAADGSLSRQAVTRIEGALLAKAYGNTRLVAAMTEATDTNIKAIGSALTDVAGAWAKMRAASADGTIADGLDITDALNEAVTLVEKSRTEGTPLKMLVGQGNMFSGENVSPEAEALLRLMFKGGDFTAPSGRTRLADALNFYVEQAMLSSADGGLFGDAPPTALSTVAAARDFQDGQKSGGQGSFLAQAEAAQPPRQDATVPRTERGDTSRADAPQSGGQQNGQSVATAAASASKTSQNLAKLRERTAQRKATTKAVAPPVATPVPVTAPKPVVDPAAQAAEKVAKKAEAQRVQKIESRASNIEDRLDTMEIDDVKKSSVVAYAKKLAKDGDINEGEVAEVAAMAKDRDMGVEDLVSELKNAVRYKAEEKVKEGSPESGAPKVKVKQQRQNGSPVFYSALKRAVEGSKMPVAPASQWKATLLNTPGIKADELSWTGLLNALDMDPTAPMTREQLATIVEEGGIVVEEVIADGPDDAAIEERAQQIYDEALEEARDEALRDLEWNSPAEPERNEDGEWEFDGDVYDTEEEARSEWEAADEAARDEAEERFFDSFEYYGSYSEAEEQARDELGDGVKYKQYSSENKGGNTYGEILLTLPVGKGNNPESQPYNNHWDEQRTIAHIRYTIKTDADGKRVMFVEEIQSDWHQKAGTLNRQAKKDFVGTHAILLVEAGGTLAQEYNDALASPNREKELPKLYTKLAGLVKSLVASGDLAADHPAVSDLNEIEARPDGYSPRPNPARIAEAKAAFDAATETAKVSFNAMRDAQDSGGLVSELDRLAERYYADRAETRRLGRAYDEARGAITNGGIPEAPFRATWAELAMKRAIRWAVDNDIDRIAWINGDQQNGRQTAQDEGVAYFYNSMLPKTVAKLVGKYGAKVAPMSVNTGFNKERTTITLGEISDAPEVVEARRAYDEANAAAEAIKVDSLPKVREILDELGGDKEAARIDPRYQELALPYKEALARVADANNALDRAREAARARIRAERAEASESNNGFDITPELARVASGGFPMFQKGNPQNTPNQQARAKVAAKVEAAREQVLTVLKQLGIEDKVALEVVRRLGDGVAGQFSGGRDPLIQIAALVSPDVEFTTRHEAIHFLKEVGAFTDIEWEAMAKLARADADLMAWAKDNYPDLNAEEQLEEAIAENFAKIARGQMQPKGFVRTAFEKLAKLVRMIREALGVAGITNAEIDEAMKVIDAVASGEKGRVLGEAAAAGTDIGSEAFVLPKQQRLSPLNQAAQPDPSLTKQILIGAKGLVTAMKLGDADKSWAAIDNWRVSLQDKMLPLLRVQDKVEQQLGRKLTDDENPYIKEELYSSKVGFQLKELTANLVEPLMDDVNATGIKLDELDEYLYARHAPERNARMAAINPKFNPGEGSGMTDAEAAQIMADVASSGKQADYDRLAAHVDKLIDFAIQTRIDGGLLSLAEANLWRQTYKFYVPLRGHEELDPEENSGKPRQGRGIGVKGAESRRAFGRQSKAQDILAYTLLQAEEAIVRSQKNEVAVAMSKLVKAFPDGGFWKIDKVSLRPVWNKTKGQVEYQAQRRLTPGEEARTVTYKVDGVEHRITIDPDGNNETAARLAVAMKNIGPTQMGPILSRMAVVGRYLSKINTSWNPEFVITNALRDLQEASINLTRQEIDGLIAGVVKDVATLKPALAAAKGEFGKSGNSVWDRWYREFEEAGGKVEFNHIDDVKALSDRIAKMAKNRTLSRIDARRIMPAFLKAIESANGGVENAVRVAVFKNARERGVSVQQAASMAKNASINFNRHGTLGPSLNAVYIFFNAGVQGSTNLAKTLYTSKTGRRVALGMLITGMALDALNEFWGDDDDDGQSFYSKIPEFEKERNWILMTPSLGRGKYVKLAMPWGYNIFPTTGRLVSEVYHGRKSPLEAAMADSFAALNAFNPLSSPTLGNMISPTLSDPLIDLYRNKNFADKPIVPSQPIGSAKEVPNSQLYWNSTSNYWRSSAAALNALSGGTEVEGGALDVSPETMRYLFSAATGGAGTFVDRVVNLTESKGPTDKFTMNDVPFARRVFADAPEWYDKTAYYNRLMAIELSVDQRKRYVERGDAAGEADKMRRDGDILSPAIVTLAKVTRRQQTAINKQKNALKKQEIAGTVTAAEASKKRVDLAKQQDDLVDRFNKQWVSTLGENRRVQD